MIKLFCFLGYFDFKGISQKDQGLQAFAFWVVNVFF